MDGLNRTFEPREMPESMQRLLYIEESVPKFEMFEDEKMGLKPDQCLPITGVLKPRGQYQLQDYFQPFTHVARFVLEPHSDLKPTDNLPHRGTDKLVFYNFDVHGTFFWQAVYSTALFLEGDDYQILTL